MFGIIIDMINSFGLRLYTIAVLLRRIYEFGCILDGATENAGVENAIQAKMQGGKCRSGKCGSR